jgi:hypothetical protein
MEGYMGKTFNESRTYDELYANGVVARTIVSDTGVLYGVLDANGSAVWQASAPFRGGRGRQEYRQRLARIQDFQAEAASRG